MNFALPLLLCVPAFAEPDLREQAKSAIVKSVAYFHKNASRHGGYVWFLSEDLSQRVAEGKAGPSQVAVQPPGTPAVGIAFVAAHRATGDAGALKAAREAAVCLLYGQLKSGGWRPWIDFSPNGSQVDAYRNGQGRGKNYSTLDDNSTQASLLMLMRLDEVEKFADAKVHDAVVFGLDALLAAQYPNGSFPQVWTGPSPNLPVLKPTLPENWRTPARGRDYWLYYTLNDNLAGDVASVLVEAHRIYGGRKYLDALRKLGDFLILAQLPAPQPAWAQQYDHKMQPAWARKFEPPAVTGWESQDAIETLLLVAELSGDRKYLAPVEPALKYLKASLLADGRLARFYELATNKPLYMDKQYRLTYDDGDVPTHYGFKVPARLDALEAEWRRVEAGKPKPARTVSEGQVRKILAALDDQGRWVDDTVPRRGFAQGRYLMSATFAKNVETLAEFLIAGAR